MDTNKVVAELQHKYPGKKIIKLPEDSPTEILCEYEPTENHPEWSEAISVLDKSVPHYHKVLTETYEIQKGGLVVYKGKEKLRLKEGDTLVIEPGVIHWAEGSETWIKVSSNPGWAPEDHIIQKTNKARENNP